ncbi:MAG: SatD family protein [Candidatus Acidiferrales bacterium]
MTKKTKLYAVILAHVIAADGRRRLRPALHKLLRDASEAHQRSKLALLPYAVTAGEEFQTITGNLAKIPWLLLDLRAGVQPIPLRIGVGIGEVSGRIAAPVNQMDGPAFRMARQALDRLKHARKSAALTAFCSANKDFDQTANLVYALHDTLVRKMTAKQWKTVAARIEHDNVQDTARALGLDASTVSRNLKRGYYGQLVAAAFGVEQLIGERFAQALNGE